MRALENISDEDLEIVEVDKDDEEGFFVRPSKIKKRGLTDRDISRLECLKFVSKDLNKASLMD